MFRYGREFPTQIILYFLVLEISPTYQASCEYVGDQRLEHYNDLANVVDGMRIIPFSKQDNPIYKYVVMYLIERRTYMMTFEQVSQLKEAKLCFTIVNAVCRLDLSSCDTYWISRNFTTLVREKVHPEILCLVSYQRLTKSLLNVC